MTINEILKNDSYIFYCKENYMSGILPGGIDKQTSEYKRLVEIAQLYFKNNLQDNFAGHLENGHYFIQLWTAHLILEYGRPDSQLRDQCLEEIKRYATHPLQKEVAEQETKWLDNYFKTLKNKSD